MKRLIGIFTGIFVMLGAIVTVQALAYLVGGLAEEYLFEGASRLTNIIFLMMVFVMIMATLLTMAERKWSALMQNRIGPNRAKLGPIKSPLMGLPHILTDSLKMLTKERFRPEGANKFLFNLGPILAFAPVFALFAVVPVGPSVRWGTEHVVDMVVATPDFGLLYLLGVASLAVYGTALAGWASNNKFALLGGVRASSQMISYEVALGLSLVGLMIAFSTVQLPPIVGQMANEGAGAASGQARFLWALNENWGLPAWGIFLQPLGFILFFAASFAETKRAPFDSPEGESEIIGYFVEYSGMQFGLFMISEFVEVVVLSGVLTVLFFGGWHLPIYGEALAASAFMKEHGWIYGTLLGTVFWLKVLLLIWLQLTIRWTFPRFRYDQIMTLGWKILLPAGLVNLFLSAALVLWDPSLRALAVMGLLEIAFVLVLTVTKRETAGAHGGHGHGALDHGHGGHAIAAHGHGATAHGADHGHAAAAPAATH